MARDMGDSFAAGDVDSTVRRSAIRRRHRDGFAAGMVAGMGIHHASGERMNGLVDPDTMRRLLVHEARVHAMPDRELRDLGDAHPPVRPGRAGAVLEPGRGHPVAGRRRRLRSTAGRGRWSCSPRSAASPTSGRRRSTTCRATSSNAWSRTGFMMSGAGCMMAMTGPRALPPWRCSRDGARRSPSSGWGTVQAGGSTTTLADIVSVLLRCVRRRGGPPAGGRGRDGRLAGERARSPTTWSGSTASRPRSHGGRRSMGVSYLSSIGTAAWARGRGLGEMVTMAAAADARRGRQRVGPSRRLRRQRRSPSGCTTGLGFEMLGAPAPDLLLIG